MTEADGRGVLGRGRGFQAAGGVLAVEAVVAGAELLLELPEEPQPASSAEAAQASGTAMALLMLVDPFLCKFV